MRRTGVLIWVLAGWMGSSVFAVRVRGNDEELGRAVARLSLLNGDVSVRRGDSGDWVSAVVNAPLVVDDAVVTGVNSRAEIQFDWANMIRLGPHTEIRLAELEHRRYTLQLVRGLTTFRVLRDFDADVEISTPSVSVRPLKRGTYRVEVLDNGETEVIVRDGEAEIFTPRGSERVREGRMMVARGPASDPEYKMMSADRRDEWDRWNEDRDRFFARTRSYRYVHPSIYGADDLDDYGTWIYVPPYGWVWSPRVWVGWAPYVHGRWIWIDWYGWTWLSYDPWGWAPFHYGRWFYHPPYGWCWWPGPRVYHYWRPALVAFFGWSDYSGFGFGFGIGFARIGWVPLAPYEVYYPWYGRRVYAGYRHITYIDNSVHIVNTTNIVNVYKNLRVLKEVPAVDAREFGRGRHNLVRLEGHQIKQVSVLRGVVPVVPARESLRFRQEDRAPSFESRFTGPERFVTRRPISRAEKVPFDEQARALESVVRRMETRRVEPGRLIGTPDSGVSRGSELPAPNASGARAERGWRPATAQTRRQEEGRSEVEMRGAQGTVNLPGSERSAPPKQGANRSESRTTDGWRRVGSGVRIIGADPGSSGAGGKQDGGWTPPNPNHNDDSGWRRFGTMRTSPGAESRWAEDSDASFRTPTVIRIPARREGTDGQRGASSQIDRETAPSVVQGRRDVQPRRVPEAGSLPSLPGWSTVLGRSSGGDETSKTERRQAAPIRISPPIIRQREAVPQPRVAPAPTPSREPSGGFGSPRATSPGNGASRVERSPIPARGRTR